MSPRPTAEESQQNLSRFYRINRADPPDLFNLRERYRREMKRRWEELADAIEEAIVEHDAFGVNPEPSNITRMTEIRRASTSGQHAAFMRWLRGKQEELVLETARAPLGITDGATSAWQNQYIKGGYSAGVRHASEAINRAVENANLDSDVKFGNPLHTDELGMAMTRAHEQLSGVAEAFDQRASREVADWLATVRRTEDESIVTREGLATTLRQSISAVGIYRGDLVAETEIMEAFTQGAAARYKEAGVDEGVPIIETNSSREQALQSNREFGVVETAGDDRVCDICISEASMRPRPMDMLSMLFPIHPRCRCVVVPVPPGHPDLPDEAPSLGEIDEFDDEFAQVRGYQNYVEDRFGMHADFRDFDPEQARLVAETFDDLDRAGLLRNVQGNLSVRGDLSFYPGFYDPDTPIPRIVLDADRWGRPNQQWANAIAGGHNTGISRAPSRTILVHETGHAKHFANFSPTSGAANTTIARRVDGPWTPAQRVIAREVSGYAAENPHEFVAETYTGRVHGVRYSPLVRAMYRYYGGPPVDEVDWRFAGNKRTGPITLMSNDEHVDELLDWLRTLEHDAEREPPAFLDDDPDIPALPSWLAEQAEAQEEVLSAAVRRILDENDE